MYFGLGHMGAGFGRLGSASSKRGASGVSLTTPILTWTTDSSDATPEFEGDFVDLQEGDVGRLEWTLDSDPTFASIIGFDENTADAGEVVALQLNFVVGALGDDDYLFRLRHSRGAVNSAWSDSEAVTIAAGVAGSSFGARYWGRRYYGQRAFG